MDAFWAERPTLLRHGLCPRVGTSSVPGYGFQVCEYGRNPCVLVVARVFVLLGYPPVGFRRRSRRGF